MAEDRKSVEAITQEKFNKITEMLGDYTTARARELAAEIQHLPVDEKLALFSRALEDAEGIESEGNRIYQLWRTAWGKEGRAKLTVRWGEWRKAHVKTEVKQRRSLLYRYNNGVGIPEIDEDPEFARVIDDVAANAAQARKFERADDFYQGDFYQREIGHLAGYRGDFTSREETVANLNEYGQYHFGRLIDVAYHNRILKFTNELGNEIQFNYSPSKHEIDPDELWKDALSYKGKPILVTMKTSAVDGLLSGNEFFAWDDDPYQVVGAIEQQIEDERLTGHVGRIRNKKLAARVVNAKRNNKNHMNTPNWRWINIGKLKKISESKNAVTLIGSMDMTRYFINKNAVENWEEVRNLADKLEAQEVLICISQRPDKTPIVFDVVPARDPIEFLTERFEMSQEENSRRRSAIHDAEETNKERLSHLHQKRVDAELAHEEETRQMLYQARQHLDAKLQEIEAEQQVVKNTYDADMREAKSRLDASVREQQNLVTQVGMLQDMLRAEAKKVKTTTKVGRPPRKSNARRLADLAGELNRAPREATEHIREQTQPWSALSQRLQDQSRQAAEANVPAPPDARDLELQLVKEQLRRSEAERERDNALSEAALARMQADTTKLRVSIEQYRNMSESDRADLITQLADYHQEQWTDDERKAQKAAAVELAEELKGKIGLSFPVNIPGKYARNSFTMRTGKTLAKDNKVTIELKEHIYGNDYLVYIQEHMVETIACLQKDKRNRNQVAVITFKSQRRGWVKAENEVKGGSTIKTTLSVEECLEIFEATQSKLDFHEL